MPNKAPAAAFEDAIRAYVSDESCEQAAARFHVGEIRLRDALRERGFWRSVADCHRLARAKGAATRKGRLPPNPDAVAAYAAGVSENEVAKRYGVARLVVRRWLVAAGVPVRDQVAANRLLSASRTPEQHRAYAEAAHAKVRGVPKTFDDLCKKAVGRQRVARPGSLAEVTFREWLAERGIETIAQQAIGPYNTDLGAAPVAVEIFGGGWHGSGTHAKRAPKRAKYVLDAGWHIVIIWVDGLRHPLGVRAADYVATFVEFARSNPAARREYRVIRGDGEDCTALCPDLDDLARVPAFSRGAYVGRSPNDRPRDKATGMYRRGAEIGA